MRMLQKNRRHFLRESGGAVAAALTFGNSSGAHEKPRVTRPRATDGDDAWQPHWDEQLTITVGPQSANIVGTNDKAIQAAVDYVARIGAGTVHLLPGIYELRNVEVAQGVTICWMGERTDKCPVIATLSEHGQMLANLDPWRLRRYGFEFAPHRVGRSGLHVKTVLLSKPPG